MSDRKPGRPRLENPRGYRCEVAMTDAERDTLRNAAKAAGKALAVYLRESALTASAKKD